MAANEFNPQAQIPNAQDFTGASKGFTDNSLGNFASGLAEDLDTGLKAIDRGVAQKANDEVRSVVEDTDSQLLGIKNQGPAVDPLRQEIKSQVNNLADKKLAMDAGTIDPQHYYATIQAKIKDIRSRYSGYNDQIDDDLKQLGIDPNWQRREIIEEGLKAQAAARGSAAEAAKRNRNFVDAAINNKSIIIPLEFRAKMADPTFSQSPSNMKQLKLFMLESNDVYSRAEIEKTRAEANAATAKDQGVSLGGAYERSLNTSFYVASKNGGAYDLVKKASDTLNRDAAMNGGRVPPEDETNLRNAYRTFRTQMESARMQVKANFADSSSLFPDEMKKRDDAFTAMLDNIDKSISNKDWGGLGSNLAYVESTISGARARQLDNSAFITSQSALRANIGDGPASVVATKNISKTIDSYSADGLNAIAEDQVNGKSKSLVDSMKKYRESNPNAKPSDFRLALDNSIDMILHPEGKPSGRLNVFESLFGDENQGFWDNIIGNSKLSGDDKRAYFRVLTSPEMQKAADELSQYDPRAKTKLYSYVKYMFTKMNQDSPTDINNTIHTSSGSAITYDPTTHHLEIVPRNNPNSTAAGRLLDTTLGAANAVANWNDGMDALVPMWKKQGLDPNEMSTQLMRQLNIDVNGVFIGNPLDKFTNAISPPTQGQNFTGPRGSGTTNTEGRGDVPSLDLSKSPSGFNPRGSSTATTSNTVGDFLRNLDFNANKGSKAEPSKLGGPGSGDQSGLPAFGGPGFAQAVNTRDQPNAFQASGQELKELYDAASKAKDDPELRSIIMQHIKEITKGLSNTDGAPQSSFQPRGNPAPGTPTDAQQAQGKDVIDAITGVPSFIDAVKSGDPKEIAKQAAMAMATIIPFPAGKLVKGGEEAAKAIKGAGEVIDATTLEARRAAKGMDEGVTGSIENKIPGNPSDNPPSNMRITRLTPEDLAAGETYTSKLAKDLKAGLDSLPKTNNVSINSNRQSLVERGITSPEKLNELIQKRNAKYVIVEKRTNKIVDTAQDLKGAARKVDNRDNAYGSYGYTHYRIDE